MIESTRDIIELAVAFFDRKTWLCPGDDGLNSFHLAVSILFLILFVPGCTSGPVPPDFYHGGVKGGYLMQRNEISTRGIKIGANWVNPDLIGSKNVELAAEAQLNMIDPTFADTSTEEVLVGKIRYVPSEGNQFYGMFAGGGAHTEFNSETHRVLLGGNVFFALELGVGYRFERANGSFIGLTVHHISNAGLSSNNRNDGLNNLLLELGVNFGSSDQASGD